MQQEGARETKGNSYDSLREKYQEAAAGLPEGR